jgi:hypothetical protein
MELQIEITGVLLIVLALVHIIFPNYFKWGKELQSLSLINRQMMYVHTFFVAFMVFLMGVFCLNCSTELTGTVLGKKVALGFAVFWIVRLFVQFFGYSSALWKGKTFETTVHILFIFLWCYISTVFALVYLQ